MAQTAAQRVAADLLTPQETANLLGIRRETLCRWRQRGAGPAYVQMGRYVRYHRADVEAFLNPQK